MTDTDKAQIAALGSTRIGTLDDYRRMWTAQREAQGLPAGHEDWEAWLAKRLRETEDRRKLWSEETAHLRGVLVAEAEARETLTAKLAQAVEALDTYADHHPGCDLARPHCSCGLRDALAALASKEADNE